MQQTEAFETLTFTREGKTATEQKKEFVNKLWFILPLKGSEAHRWDDLDLLWLYHGLGSSLEWLKSPWSPRKRAGPPTRHDVR